MTRYDINSFPIEEYRKIGMQKRRAGNQGTKMKKSYRDIIITFDIETSLIPFTDHSHMYIWQMQVGNIGTVFGRTWDEFIKFCAELILDMGENQYIVVYVHNLAFEFQFLAGIYNFSIDEVFAVKSRKVIKCEMFEHIEFRCSYALTNMSLEEFTKKMKVEHVKKPGEDIDYKIYRTNTTPLDDKALQYCQNDVLGLYEALTVQLNNDGDNLYTVPMTSTGYVRRETKQALRMVNHNYIRNQIVPYEIYILLREAFRGGNTHANRFYSGQILHDVKSYDRASSYPDVQCNQLFPIAEFKRGQDSMKYILTLLEKNRPFICRVAFDNIRLTDKFWPIPYLSKDKSRCIAGGLFDNGRILSAEHAETTVTDVDLKILFDEYRFDNVYVSDVYYSRYGKLPPAYIHNIEKYFRGKTSLKGTDDDYNYMKSKNLLNSIYGMSAQDPVKQSILYDAGNFRLDTVPNEEIYNKYMKRAFQPYQWGVWTTAHARKALEDGIKIAGHNCIYVDTDSVKFIGDADFSEFNKNAIALSKQSHAFADDIKGKTHYMGVYEQEQTYARFKTLGAKKYVYEYADGEVHCTIAGVNKKLGGAELINVSRETGKDPLQLFTDGFIFKMAGGNEVIYNDFPNNEEIELYLNGKEEVITRNESIIDSEYTVGITDEYAALLAECELERLSDLWL